MEKITLMLGDNYTSHEKCNYRSINHCLHILFQFRANPIKQEMEITKPHHKAIELIDTCIIESHKNDLCPEGNLS